MFYIFLPGRSMFVLSLLNELLLSLCWTKLALAYVASDCMLSCFCPSVRGYQYVPIPNEFC